MAVDHAPGIGHLKDHGGAVFVGHLLDGELVEILRLIVCDLLSVHAKALCEISVAIEEAYGCHGHPAVRCFFDIVAGKYAKTAGIYFQSVAQTVFHGEVCHGGNV